MYRDPNLLKLALEHIEGNYTVSAEEAIAAIKEALAQEQEPVAWRNAAIRVGEDLCSVGPFGYYDMTADQWLTWALSVVTVHSFPPQRTEQEPVAWMFQHDETGRMNYVSNDGIHNPTMFLEMNPRYALVCPLYTTPPQRTWVGLTDEDIWEAYMESTVELDCSTDELYALSRTVEAKLKHKNTRGQ